MTVVLICAAIVCAVLLVRFDKAQTVKRYTTLTQTFGGRVVPNWFIGQPLLITSHGGQDLILTSALVKRSGKSPSIALCSYSPKTSFAIVDDHSGWNDPWLFNSIQSWSFGIRDKRFNPAAKLLDWRNSYRPEYGSRLSTDFNTYGNSRLLDVFLTPEVCRAIVRLSATSPLDLRFHPGARWNGKQYEPRPVPTFDISVPSRNNEDTERGILQLAHELIPVLDRVIQNYQPEPQEGGAI